MRSILFGTVASLMLVGSAAQAETVYSNSLTNLNGSNGAGIATTLTTPSGTLTTVTGPGGSANRVSTGLVYDKWAQQNVGGNATVGITDQRARSGTGSISFSGLSISDSKADLEYYFSKPLTLSDFVSASYDWFRSSTSTNNGIQAPALRFLVNTAGVTLPTSTALIFEPYYQGAPANVATDQWVTSTIDGSSIFWNNNGLLTQGSTGEYSSLSSIIAANPNLLVYGLSTGIGSGWDGQFFGGVDNIAYNFSQANANSFNFEVTAAVPETATWAMLILGFGVFGSTLRYRRKIVLGREAA